MRCILLSAGLLLALAGAASAEVVNGDFESGNSGFTTSFNYRTVSDSPYVGQYGVTTSSFAWTQFWSIVASDHTTGTGHFLIADTGPTNVTLWQETLPVSAGTNYTLGAWLATWSSYPATTLGVEINGVQLTTWAAPAATGSWAEYTAGWNSGAATSATIRLYSTVAIQPGGDVAIDDITFVPAPASGVLTLAGMLLIGRRRR